MPGEREFDRYGCFGQVDGEVDAGLREREVSGEVEWRERGCHGDGAALCVDEVRSGVRDCGLSCGDLLREPLVRGVDPAGQGVAFDDLIGRLREGRPGLQHAERRGDGERQAIVAERGSEDAAREAFGPERERFGFARGEVGAHADDFGIAAGGEAEGAGVCGVGRVEGEMALARLGEAVFAAEFERDEGGVVGEGDAEVEGPLRVAIVRAREIGQAGGSSDDERGALVVCRAERAGEVAGLLLVVAEVGGIAAGVLDVVV